MVGTRDLFAQHNIRCTAQRMAVYEALCRTDAHPSAEELFHLVRPRTGRLSLATVYNTLDVLCRAGLCRRVPTNGGCRYDADVTDHIHIKLQDSGAICDVPPELGQKIVHRISREMLDHIGREMGVHIEGFSMQLHAVHRPLPGARSSGGIA